MVSDQLLVLFLQRFLEGGLVVEKEEKFEETENREKTSNLGDTVHDGQGRNGGLVERVVVVGVLKEDSHVVVAEIFELILIVGLGKGKVKICYQ